MTNYWQLECEEVLRALINDMSTTPTYTAKRLIRIIVVAALQVVQEVAFSTTYTIDISKATISPDPAATDTKDNNFINLVCLKAAAILLNGELRYYAINSFRVNDGPSSIDVTSRVIFVKEAARIMNEKYEKLKFQHQSGQIGELF